jgi:hypothetical protein
MDQNVKDLLDTVNFIKDYMMTHLLTKDEGVTKSDLHEALKPIEDRLTAVESKIAGTNRRLDDDAMARADLALPKRVSDLEEKTFGASRHPAHVPLK